MTTGRSPEEAFAAGQADSAADPPLSQEEADEIAVILASSRSQDRAGYGHQSGSRTPT
jgi:hypothetical protein